MTKPQPPMYSSDKALNFGHALTGYNAESHKWQAVNVSNDGKLLFEQDPDTAQALRALVTAINKLANKEIIDDGIDEPTLSDLQTAIAGVQTSANTLLQNLSGVASSSDLANLQTDATTLKTDVTTLKTNITSLLQQLSGLASASALSSLQSDVNSIISSLSGISSAISSIEFTPDYTDLLAAITNIIRPSGHVNPDAGLFPVFFSPKVIRKYYDYFDVTSVISNSYAYGDFGLDNSSNRPLSVDDLENIKNLDVSHFQSLSFVFNNLTYENTDLDLSNWDVSNVKRTNCFMKNCKFHDVDLSNWDTRNFQDLRGMFASSLTNSSNFNYFNSLKVDNWNVNNIQSMDYLFCNVAVAELDLSTWDMSYVTSFTNTFYKYSNSAYPKTLSKLLWGGSCNANLDLSQTIITPENAELFFQSLGNKMTNAIVTITMPSTAQGADISIATNKGYTIAGITAP